MLIADDNRVYVDCNQAAAALLECPRERIVGAHIDEFTPVDLREQLPKSWVTFLNGSAREGSNDLITCRGTSVTVYYSATPNFLLGRHLSILMKTTEPTAPPGKDGVPAGRPLSERQRQILARIAMGATGRQIAAELHISPETVRTHLRNILTKLGAQTRPHAVL